MPFRPDFNAPEVAASTINASRDTRVKQLSVARRISRGGGQPSVPRQFCTFRWRKIVQTTYAQIRRDKRVTTTMRVSFSSKMRTFAPDSPKVARLKRRIEKERPGRKKERKKEKKKETTKEPPAREDCGITAIFRRWRAKRPRRGNGTGRGEGGGYKRTKFHPLSKIDDAPASSRCPASFSQV